MPDIEMLKLLSGIFDISINELLSGERLSDIDFRKAADKNIIAVSKERAFSIKENTAFWKHKWLKEHIPLILICILAFIGVMIFAGIIKSVWLIGASIPLFLIFYMVLRNKMMIYIENHIYGKVLHN